ncbi:MAG TPA: dockerin type I domain-containing protein [Chiayiivirga sp.]|nr:dockerin type I domain-containing protein [Chiayiivirga sp.]
MKISNKLLLAAALTMALPMGSAMACTVTNWSSATNAAAGNQKGRNSEPAVPRYSGECALKADSAGSSFVTDNTPGTEATYRSRFYVYTGSAASGSKIFAATSGDNGGGTEAFSISITGGAFTFAVNGTTVGTTVPATANKWYAIESIYRASGAFQAKVRGANAATETVVNSDGSAGAVNVGSAQMGVLNAVNNATAMAFDAFESTRSDATEIGRLCPGDANNDNFVNSGDALAAINEFPPTGPYSLGQPDCNQDGFVNSGDAICAMNRFTVIAQRNCAAN